MGNLKYYLPGSILILIAISIPLSGLLFSRARARRSAPLGNTMQENMESFSQRLSHISELIEKIRTEDEKSPRADSEILRLTQETERAVAAAQEVLADLAQQPEFASGEEEGQKRTLH